MNASEISNGIYEIYDVWNEADNEKVPDKKRGKYHNSLITDDDRSLIFSRRFSKNLKENFSNHKQKHNASLKLWHGLNTKNLSIFWLITNKNRGMVQKPVGVVKKRVQI